ncbi:Z1 domain-containing protein [Phascolarctobacterium sp.]
MEQYTYACNSSEEITIYHNKYFDKVHNKHKITYGEFGAKNIRDNIVTTFIEAIKQTRQASLNNNMLLIGKVQSGKTSNLELFTALAFDNGFNLVIIYGGYDNTLLTQTTNRFKATFDIPNEIDYNDNSPVVFSSDDNTQLLSVDNEIIEDLIEADKPIFLIAMKRPAALKKVNDLLCRINKTQLKSFIIDDEGDQASLNTEKNKQTKESPTYKEIIDMKRHLNNPLYLSVTATPQANIFLDEYSQLRPDSIRLIEPGIGYCGAESYHLFDSSAIEIIPDEDQENLTSGNMPVSLLHAIHHYIIASAIMHKCNQPKSDMIIHSHRTVNEHGTIYRCVDAYIQEFKDIIDNNDQVSLHIRFTELNKSYKKLFSKNIQYEHPFETLKSIIHTQIIKRIYIILKNSAGQITQSTEKLRKHKIYIGGDLLQRGVTFANLVTTYFSRWANDSGNMDTNLQRARWFGYRSNYIDLCKIFTTQNISREFTTLSEIDEDLWEQFYSIQSGEMAIDDILLHADNTKQRPTRKNVATYSSVTFKNKWIKQRIGIFDKLQLETNNRVVTELINKTNWAETTAGRIYSDNAKTTATYAIINKKTLSELIDQIQTVFDLEPFEKKSLKDLIDQDAQIPVILMNGSNFGIRERSFYQDNKIFALHQGADNKDKQKAKFRGDSFVIIDRDKVNIQIYKIRPKKKDINGNTKILTEFDQFMFAVYVPKEKKYYIKG